jgi:hypothetical protein
MLILSALCDHDINMQYHKAAFLGSERSKKAQIKLFEYTGFAMLTYTIKNINNDFQPVGEEMLIGKMTRGEEIMLFICDRDGYAKAQSKPLPISKGEEIYRKIISDGISEFVGDIKTVT